MNLLNGGSIQNVVGVIFHMMRVRRIFVLRISYKETRKLHINEKHSLEAGRSIDLSVRHTEFIHLQI